MDKRNNLNVANMRLKACEVLKVLKRKKVKYLYHANTILTSCAFIKMGRILSRECVDEKGFAQTNQASDSKDKQFGIYDRIFMDTVDIHARGLRNNIYGPVLFVLDMDILSDPKYPYVFMTRKNPIKWDGRETSEKHFYVSCEDIEKGFNYGDFGSSIMIDNKHGILLKEYMVKILIDDPSIEINGVSVYDYSFSALKIAWDNSPLYGHEKRMYKRSCVLGCSCKRNYKSSYCDVNKLFVLSNI